MITKSLLTLLIACLSATMMCLAKNPSNLRRMEGVELVENQYIVQFDKLLNFEETKQNVLNDNEVQVVRHIDTRNIGVYKFASKKAATKWRDSTEGVKYFEAGESKLLGILLHFSKTRVPSPPFSMICFTALQKKGGGHLFLRVLESAAYFYKYY